MSQSGHAKQPYPATPFPNSAKQACHTAVFRNTVSNAAKKGMPRSRTQQPHFPTQSGRHATTTVSRTVYHISQTGHATQPLSAVLPPNSAKQPCQTALCTTAIPWRTKKTCEVAICSAPVTKAKAKLGRVGAGQPTPNTPTLFSVRLGRPFFPPTSTQKPL